MKKTLLALAVVTMLSGCAVMQHIGVTETDPTLTTQREAVKKEFDTIPSPSTRKPLSVAVYSFQDKTGQRRPQSNVASLSTAVTQGGETFLIQALQNVGRGEWFDVVERVGIDNLTKERLIIRQMREAYEGSNARPLMPMQFAGIILEGGIIGYDTSTTSGGAGMRIFGIGKQTQWSTDTVTVSLRAVSVNTGKVIASVTVQKTILSSADSVTALKFFDQGTQSFEGELGMTLNEPGTYATKAAIELAVVELIKEGQRKGVWDYYHEPIVLDKPAESPKPTQPVISSEIKKSEENKDELVQQKAEAKGSGETEALSQQSNSGKTVEGTKEQASPRQESKSEKHVMLIKERSKLYHTLSDLKGPRLGSYTYLQANTPVEVKNTEYKDVVEVLTDSGLRGYIQQDKLVESGKELK